MRNETRKKFNVQFINKLKNGLGKYFGERRANHILKLMANGTLELVSPETFFFYGGTIQDPAIKIYQESKTIEEFMFKYQIALKSLLKAGCSNITICELFWVLSDYFCAHKRELVADHPNHIYLKSSLHSLINTVCSIKDDSPFTIRIIDVRLKEVATKTGLDLKSYLTIIKYFFLELDTISKWSKHRFKLPKFEMCYGIYNDVRVNIVNCISSRLQVRDETVNGLLKNVPDLTEDSVELRTALKAIAAVSNFRSCDIDSLILEIKRISKIPKMKVFSGDRSLTSTLMNCGIPRKVVKKYKIQPIFANLELFSEGSRPAFSEVRVNCRKIYASKTTPFPRIEGWIDYAKDLCLMRKYAIQGIPSAELPPSPLFKIVLENVKSPTQEFVTAVKEKTREIQSLTNQEFVIEINYDWNVVNKKVDFSTTTHFRVISDLHVDINQKQGYSFNFGEDFILNCGDTAGDEKTATDWLKGHVKGGVTTFGNHLGYAHPYPEKDGIKNLKKWNSTTDLINTKNAQIKRMSEDLVCSEVRLLSNSATEFKGIHILGTCLYTDFMLYGEDHREECMNYAQKYLNDFKYVEISKHCEYFYLGDGKWRMKKKGNMGSGDIKTLTPNDHAFYFFYSLNWIKQTVAEHRGEPIIIITHHAPSPHSIAPQYQGDLLNAAFTSDLNEFIINNPNIRLWCHGHTHVPFDYILGETRVVCSPFGYYNENNYDLPFNYGTRIAIDDVKSMTSWKKLCKKEIKEGLIKVYKD